jgi:hypothetical protein
VLAAVNRLFPRSIIRIGIVRELQLRGFFSEEIAERMHLDIRMVRHWDREGHLHGFGVLSPEIDTAGYAGRGSK